MVIITSKTIFNEKVGYYFFQVILLFWQRQKMVQHTKYKIEKHGRRKGGRGFSPWILKFLVKKGVF